MDPVALVIMLAVGAVAGWLAGRLMGGGSYGLLGNILIGLVGSVLAGFLFPRFGLLIGGGLVGAIINAALGACLLIFLARLIRRA